MKKLRPSNLELVANTKEDEILDNVIDYCMSDDDPALRYDRHGHQVPSSSAVPNPRCDEAHETVGDFLGAFAARLVLPSACGPDAGLAKTRSVAHRPYVCEPMSDFDHRYPDPFKPKVVRKERKVSGIMSNRSEDDGDDWDPGVTSKIRTNGKGRREEISDASGHTYIVRVGSRESMVSELTELVPRNGVLRKNSGRSERALSGMESVSQPSVSTPLQGMGPNRSFANWTSSTRRVGDDSQSRRGSSRSNFANHLQGRGTTLPFRVFHKDIYKAQSPDPFVADDNSDSLQVRNGLVNPFKQYAHFDPSPIAEEDVEDDESYLEGIEVVRKIADRENQASADKQNKPRQENNDTQTNSGHSHNSAFTPVRRRDALDIHSPHGHAKSLNSHMVSLDKQSQNTNSTDSTARRRNHTKPGVSCEKSKCDTTVSTTSGNSILDHSVGKQHFCKSSTNLFGGLFLCGRGNKVERAAAEKEEWSHILVYEPTPKASNTELSKPIPTRAHISPLTILTEGTSLETSKAMSGSATSSGSPMLHNMPNKVHVPVEQPQPSLLLERRKAALKAKMQATLQNAMAESPRGKMKPTEGEDTRDARDTVDTQEDTRDIGKEGTFSDDEDAPSLQSTKETKQEGFNLPGFNTQIWPFSGVTEALTSELDQLAPLGPPKSPRKGRGSSPRRSPRRVTSDGSSKRRSRSPRKSKSPQLTDTFSEYGTELTSNPSLIQSADSTYTGWTSVAPYFKYGGTVYDRKRMASREKFPTFHWQASIADGDSIGVISLDY